MTRTCGWVSTGVETPEQLLEGAIGSGESGAEQVGVPEGVLPLLLTLGRGRTCR
jgi:hypothetical protein